MRRLLVAIGVAVVAAGFLPPSGVATAVDSGVGSVIDVANEASYRAALALLSGQPSGEHTINLAGSFVITGATDPSFTNADQPLTIRGNGFTINGDSTRRILDSTSTGTLVLEDINVLLGGSDGDGAGIRANGDVIVRRSLMIGGVSQTVGGAIAASGDVTIIDSTLSGNYGAVAGGAIHAESSRGATVTVTRSTLHQNFTGGEGGAIKVLGVVNSLNSTFDRNFAVRIAGALSIESPVDGVSSIRYTTFSENRAASAATLLAGNDAGDPSEIDMTASVVGGASGGKCVLLENTVIFATHSFEDGDQSCGFVGPDQSAPGGNAQLGMLQFNGGRTETVLPASTSPLVDAIPPAQCPAGVHDDQRGVSRPQGAGCDIGAVELATRPPGLGAGPGDDPGTGTPGAVPDGTPGTGGGTGTAQPPSPADVPRVTPRFTG